MSHRMARLQVYFSKNQKADIDRARKLTGESFSAYVRKALEEKVKIDKQEEQDLKALAQKVLGTPVKKSGWEGVDPIKWERQVRQEEEEHWLKRWDEAEKSVKKEKGKKKNVSSRYQRFYPSARQARA